MKYFIGLNPRPFESIKKGIKKIEGRTPINNDVNTDFSKFKADDIIEFTNNETNEKMKVKVLGVRHYKTVKLMLETEGTRNILSSQGTVEEGIASYNRLDGYKEGVKKFGIYAIEVARL